MKLHKIIIFTFLTIIGSLAVMSFKNVKKNKLVKTGFLFFIENQLDGFFIESREKIISEETFLNNSYRVFERICTRSPHIDAFRKTKIGERIKFESLIFNGDTLENKELNFIYCKIEITRFEAIKKMQPKLVGLYKGKTATLVNQYFNNQIDALLPVDSNEVKILIEEI